MRLIDADALIEECGEWYTEEGPEEGFIGTLKQLLDKQPTIEPKQGGWICELINPLNAILRCSACGYATGTKYNYCPNCGCDMREGANNETD